MDTNEQDERIRSLSEADRLEVIDEALNAWVLGTALDVARVLNPNDDAATKKQHEFIMQHLEMIDYVAGRAAQLLEAYFTPPTADALTVANALTEYDGFADRMSENGAFIEACVGRIAAKLGIPIALIYEDLGYRHLDEETSQKVRDIDEQLYLDVLAALQYTERKEYYANKR